MSPSTPRTFLVLSLLVVGVLGVGVLGNAAKGVSNISQTDIEQCAPVRQLDTLKRALEDEQSPVMRQVFAWLFPFGPAWNSILGTFYISSVPNLILAFIPAQINPNTLNTMTAFATGGLLSDVFLHLVPHAFMGEHQDGGVHFVMVEEKRNILIGLGIFVGFATFFIMEKTLRVLGSGGEEGHSHSHSHSSAQQEESHASAVEVSSADGLKSRKTNGSGAEIEKHDSHDDAAKNNGPSKLSAYLNLFGDFVHNMHVHLFYYPLVPR
ncbi:hypothetical protein EUX98_g6317 [Antrodiella citrinella]|uniref:Uncharacterized protein n=1 Tax=Antrodiella citrinella TaxID=2447956 RepID=A0A4S4MRY1_9APHY|nr:hypothetical protein EUX98_g6317 [Antrodiella citrinella]